jgi:hypothetical protein
MLTDDDEGNSHEFEPGLNESRIEGLFAEALLAPDPQVWLRSRVEAALKKLEQEERPPALVQEAKRQLFKIEEMLLRAIHEGKGKAGMAAVLYLLAGGVSFF